jgi:putative ABC transport system substrate-binding protein
MKRRDILIVICSTFVAPLARGQQRGRVYRIGWLGIASRKDVTDLIAALEQGLGDYGYEVGRNVVIEFQVADGKPERLPDLARELVRNKVDVIVTGVNPNTVAAMAATKTIPIVMAVGQDVIGQGFVASYARPGGNVTGLTWEIGPGPTVKRLELLKEAVARISRVAVLCEPPYCDTAFELRRALDDAALSLKLNLIWAEATDEFERSLAPVLRQRPDALFWFGHALHRARRAEIVAATAASRLPASYHGEAFVEAGGLMSYAPNVPALFRRAAWYVDRILKGARPGDLPVEQPVKLDLVINLRTARALGLTIPQPVLLRADRVIE